MPGGRTPAPPADPAVAAGLDRYHVAGGGPPARGNARCLPVRMVVGGLRPPPFQTLETFRIMSRQSRPFSRRQFGQLALAGGAARPGLARRHPRGEQGADRRAVLQLPLAAVRGRAQGDEGDRPGRVRALVRSPRAAADDGGGAGWPAASARRLARRAPDVARDRAGGPLHGHQEAFTGRRGGAAGLQPELQRQLHGPRDREGLRSGPGARREADHRVVEPEDRAAPGAVRREVQDHGGDAQPLEHRRTRTSSRRRRASPRRWRSRSASPSTSTSATSSPPASIRSTTSPRTTSGSPTCTSRIARRIRATTSPGARATRRSRTCCSW